MTLTQLIDTYYPAGTLRRDILLRHSESVGALAKDINERHRLLLEPDVIDQAALAHDVGIAGCDAPSIGCTGAEPYIRHGLLGAELIRGASLPEWMAMVALHHTGAGLTRQEILEQNLPLPACDFMPETLLEQLICYADKFYSKGGDFSRKPFAKVRQQMARHGDESLRRFEVLHQRFGID